jgi:hypothetical protein
MDNRGLEDEVKQQHCAGNAEKNDNEGPIAAFFRHGPTLETNGPGALGSTEAVK